MNSKILSFVFVLFAALIGFSSTAMAQAGQGGFDARLNLGANIFSIDSSTSVENFTGSVSGDTVYGFASTLVFGYRWTYFGVYLDQELGGIFPDEKDAKNYFVGGTYITFRGIIPAMDQLQFDLGIGLGMMYTDGKSASKVKEGDKRSLIVNKDGDAIPCFAMKFSLSASYYITKMIGIGVQFDYNLGINKIERDHSTTTLTYNHMIPGAHLIVRL